MLVSRYALLGLVLFMGGISTSQAALTIRITDGNEGAQPIAIIPFYRNPEVDESVIDISNIIASNFHRTGLFAPLPPESLPSQPYEASQIDFIEWQDLGVDYLVIGDITKEGFKRYKINFRAYDVLNNRRRTLVGFSISAKEDDLRRKAHQISDIIYEAITGDRGAFDTRIAYVTETRIEGQQSSLYELQIAASDGHAPQVLYQSQEPIISPNWSPDSRFVAYVSFEGGQPGIYMHNTVTKQRIPLTYYRGLNQAPAFSPDGNNLAMTLSKSGNPDIYIMDIEKRTLRQLTDNIAIDTEASWSPDGKSLVFTSDRSGSPQIYRTSADGGQEPARITFQGNYNARASFSPDGKKLVFVHGKEDNYHIGLLDLESRTTRVLTKTKLDESPSFSPNGVMILYATTHESGLAALSAVSSDGRIQQSLTAQTNGIREPAWSPFRDNI